ncbi:MAG: tRNA pseudouridine(55) synthase TruB [Firmicutes bacterium]|nr:tRNA pseudouridine(55) synthase TruB [Bacillota bacterium]
MNPANAIIEPGLYLTHKPVGLSSFDVVRRFKAAAYEQGLKKWPLGHGGTLDPFAEGLLLVLSGQATRLMELMHPLPKTYEATVVWGRETDTCDHLGLAVSEGDACSLAPQALESALEGFLGWQDQVPPATSAKKIDGESAYKKAHRGEEVILPPSRVYLHEAHWLEHHLPAFSRLRITCRGGYYVRSLARDLGRNLGCGAHLSALHRTAIGPWKDPTEDTFKNGLDLIPWCPFRLLSLEETNHLAHGRPIPLGDIQSAPWAWPGGFPQPQLPIRGLAQDRLVALLEPREEKLWTTANLRGGL